MGKPSFEQGLAAVSERLIALAKERGVLGEPLEFGDTIILPLSEIRIGFAGAGGQGHGEGESPEAVGKGEAEGGMGGGGLSLEPLALVVINGDEIWVESMEDKGGER